MATKKKWDVLIRGGTVIDGTGAPRMTGVDLAIRDGKIAALAPGLDATGASEVIDATGCVVAPGFIDVHTHDDSSLLDNPGMEYKTSQGVTTVVTGNCGISLAPFASGSEVLPPLNLLGSIFEFPSVRSFFEAIDAAPAAVNAVCLCGHTTLRIGVMGKACLDRPASPTEVVAMQTLLGEALDAGAIGLSTGLAYGAAISSTTDEVIALAKLLEPANAIYTTHLRDESSQVIAAMEEAFRIGREAAVPVVLSHHKVTGKDFWGLTEETLRRIDAARKEQPVALDVYPYDASSTVLKMDAVERSQRVTITWSEAMPSAAGKDLFDLHRSCPCFSGSHSIADTAARLQPAGAVYFAMDEQDVRRVIEYPHSMIGSDGLPNDLVPHPRLWGSFPRVLGKYSRDEGLISLELAVHKMTGLPVRDGLATPVG
jgi:N-acyl-D-amino-acid deacylase